MALINDYMNSFQVVAPPKPAPDLQSMTGQIPTYLLNPNPPQGGGNTQQAVVDPYAQWGGKQNYNNLMSGFDTQKSNTINSLNTQIGTKANEYRSGIANTIEGLKQGQREIDSKATQNELARRQGRQGVMSMVDRGLKQGGTLLSQKNAVNSSAAEALGRLYGDLGRRQLSDVGNQYQNNNNEIAVDQASQDFQLNEQTRKLIEDRDAVVNNILVQARQAFGALQGAMAGASLGDRINIEKEIEAVRQNAVNQLQQYDSMIAEGKAAAVPTTAEQRRSKALEMANAGQAPENAFSFMSSAPAQLRASGPFSSSLPLFTLPRTKQE